MKAFLSLGGWCVATAPEFPAWVWELLMFECACAYSHLFGARLPVFVLKC